MLHVSKEMIAEDYIISTLSNLQNYVKAWTAAVVMQGPHYGDQTRLVMEQFLSKNKQFLLIVSTYEVTISPWEQKLVDDGKLVFIFVRPPPPENQIFWKTNYANQNLQRLTTYIGLRHAASLGILFALKIRTDVFLGRRSVIRHLIELVEEYPVMPDVKVVDQRGRIVVCSHSTVTHPDFLGYHTPFHIRDHWYFGFTEDLIRFFDINSRTWAGGLGIACHSPESSLTEVWMRDLGIQASGTEELLARYFIVEDYERLEQCRTHDPKGGQRWVVNMPDYLLRGVVNVVEFLKLLDDARRSTTHGQWLQMMEKIKP